MSFGSVSIPTQGAETAIFDMSDRRQPGCYFWHGHNFITHPVHTENKIQLVLIDVARA
jgi:hypothetical protein